MKPLNLDEFILRSKTVHNDRYDYSSVVYTGSETKVKIICPEHGPFEQTPKNHLRGRGCSKCGRKKVADKLAFTTEEFISRARKVHGDKYDYSEAVYRGINTKVKIICPEHGPFEQTPNTHLRPKSPCGCPRCAHDRSSSSRVLTTEEFVSRARMIHGEKYDYSEAVYDGWESRPRIYCYEHGGYFNQIAKNHLDGQGCPQCNRPGVKLQRRVIQYLRSIGVEAQENVRGVLGKSQRDGGRQLELDIYLPKHRVGIEVHGNYFHSEFKKTNAVARTMHLEKFEKSLDADIFLLQFYEDELLQRFDIVKRMIDIKIGAWRGGRVYARNCQLASWRTEDLEPEERRFISDFFEQNHIQGPAKFSEAYALVEDGDLVAVMLFNNIVSQRGVRKSKDAVELVRFATTKLVTGGASKLFKAFLKDYPEVLRIVSYSDNRISQGNVYQVLGFELTSVVPPSYYYTLKTARSIHSRLHKSNFKRSSQAKKFKNFDPNLTEYENALNNGYNRIWDAGKLKWEYFR